MFAWACLPQILGLDKVVVVLFYRLKLLKFKQEGHDGPVTLT